MDAVEIGPVPPERRTQSAFDLFLVFAAANVVATTLQTGASLAPAARSLPRLAGVLLGGILGGSLLIAALATVGPRLGVPSVIAARAALGRRGAALVALLLYGTNFAWIAVNNVIAASACASVWGGPRSRPIWSGALGLLSTAIVAGGPRLVVRADRLAVPLLALVGGALTAAALRLPAAPPMATAAGALPWPRALDIVAGYQVSWILMFADYSRYTRSPARAGVAVFAGLAITSLWLIPLGVIAARSAGSADPGAMLAALGVGAWGAILLAVATVTTNFVNIYMSGLALRSLVPGAGDQSVVWSTGLIGAALGLFPGVWLDRYAGFMVVLGGILVPVGGVLLARFFLVRRPVDVASLYDGGPGRVAGIDVSGLAAWAAGAAAYILAAPAGGTVPSLVTAIAVYLGLESVFRNRGGLSPDS
jgi:NCS1 family nucleobase:cation symporter-1